jgi:drug/metabolite transporter (DMT)-like permease
MSAALSLVISGICFAVVYAGVKMMPRIPAYEIVFARSAIALILAYIGVRAAGLSPWGRNKPVLILRGVAGTLALSMFFYSLQVMPLASAVTIQFIHPIITVVIAGLIFHERPTFAQWLCFAISFFGVVMVRGFDPRVQTFDVFVGLLGAFFASCAFTAIRAARDDDPALVLTFYFPLTAVILTGPYALLHWVAPNAYEWTIIAVIGALTQAGQYFMTRAYQGDSAANISNLNCLGLVYGVAIGWLFFNEEVTVLALAGMAVITTSAYASTRFKSR